jgi:tryptophan-rich sensory protein
MKCKNDCQWRALLVLATMTALTALAGGIGSTDAPWLYVQLVRPAWSPPAWVFAPAWTLLYVLMTLSAWLVVRARGWPAARPLMLLFAAQLLTNGLWSWLFFNWRLGEVAIADIVLLLVLIVVMMVAFWRVRPLAGMLLVPYFAWVGFATALTVAMWWLNAGIL